MLKKSKKIISFSNILLVFPPKHITFNLLVLIWKFFHACNFRTAYRYLLRSGNN